MSDEERENDAWYGLENRSYSKKLASKLCKEARELCSGDDVLKAKAIKKALEKLKEANLLYPKVKYRNLIQQLEGVLKNISDEDSEHNDDDEDDDSDEENSSFEKALETSIDRHKQNKSVIEIEKGFYCKESVYKKLYTYQITGIKWLYSLFAQQKGGILADDMGLGKTVQTIVLLSSLFKIKKIKSVLIGAPTTLLINWGKEFRQWDKGIRIYKFDGSTSKNTRLNALRSVQNNGGVLLITYDLCRNFQHEVSNFNGRSFIWDYFILDEGHKIKNATKTTKALHEIPSKIRLVITGTPVQNNLRELWALYDFCMKGTLLGTYKTFKSKYEEPILRGREKQASNREKILGAKMAENLRAIYEPYFLRRTKFEVLQRKSIGGDKSMSFSLPMKLDFVVWICLSDKQIDVYKDFLSLDSIKELIMRENMRSPLVQLNIMKKICDHPRLLPKETWNQLLNNNSFGGDDDETNINNFISIENVNDLDLIKESNKLGLCLELLENLKTNGHKTILFSQSTKVLDIIQRILTTRNWKLARLDGRISNMQKRDQIVQTFQRTNLPLMLITSQVGGVGLTLTTADRVIIYDPSWNPATDNQAIDRAYRIGQKNNVVVYRLLTCGTVEEKIYQRQVFKDSIMKQTVGKTKDPTRYFTDKDLRALFEFKDPKISTTCIQLKEMHGNQIIQDEYLNSHINELAQFSNVFDLSDHNKLFSQEEPEIADEPGVIEVIDLEVQQAKTTVEKESNAALQILSETGIFARPFQLNVPTIRPTIPNIERFNNLENPTEVIDISDNESKQIDESVIFDPPEFHVEPFSLNGYSTEHNVNSLNNNSRSATINHEESSVFSNKAKSNDSHVNNFEFEENSSLDSLPEEIQNSNDVSSDEMNFNQDSDMESTNVDKSVNINELSSEKFDQSTKSYLNNNNKNSYDGGDIDATIDDREPTSKILEEFEQAFNDITNESNEEEDIIDEEEFPSFSELEEIINDVSYNEKSNDRQLFNDRSSFELNNLLNDKNEDSNSLSPSKNQNSEKSLFDDDSVFSLKNIFPGNSSESFAKVFDATTIIYPSISEDESDEEENVENDLKEIDLNKDSIMDVNDENHNSQKDKKNETNELFVSCLDSSKFEIKSKFFDKYDNSKDNKNCQNNSTIKMEVNNDEQIENVTIQKINTSKEDSLFGDNSTFDLDFEGVCSTPKNLKIELPSSVSHRKPFKQVNMDISYDHLDF